MKKVFKATGIIVGIIIFLAAIFLAVWFFWPWHINFYKNANAEFKIPGLETSFVPQAFTEVDDDDYYIVGGYMNDGSASRFYLINSITEEVEKYFTLTINDLDYVGHACGVASHGNNLWTSSNDGVGGTAYRFLLSDVLTVENGGKVAVQDFFLTNNGADNVFVHDDMLWVGEFYREGNYETDESHHIKTRGSETNMAVAFGYELNQTGDYGLQDTIPDKALSMTGLVQGMAMTMNGEIVLSTSYSLPSSKIYSYSNVLSEEKHGTIEVSGTEVDLWFLDSESLLNEVSAPAMTEEIIISNGKLYILNESACKKYKMFTRDNVDEVYSLPLDFVLGIEE